VWRSRDDIKYIFEPFIFGFIYNDIERCIKAKANYVVALALLSYTEYLGALISGAIGSRGEGGRNFKKALSYFLKKYKQVNSSIVIRYVDKDRKPMLDKKGNPKQDTEIYGLFRCGLAHEYFIKGLGKVNNNENGYADPRRIGIELENIPKNDTLYQISQKRFIFYTNEYFRDFKKAVGKVYHQLISDFDCNLKSLDPQDPKYSPDFLEDSKITSSLLKGFYQSLDTYLSRVIL